MDFDSDLWSWQQVSTKKIEFCESAKGSAHPAYVTAKDLKRRPTEQRLCAERHDRRAECLSDLELE